MLQQHKDKKEKQVIKVLLEELVAQDQLEIKVKKEKHQQLRVIKVRKVRLEIQVLLERKGRKVK